MVLVGRDLKDRLVPSTTYLHGRTPSRYEAVLNSFLPVLHREGAQKSDNYETCDLILKQWTNWENHIAQVIASF